MDLTGVDLEQLEYVASMYGASMQMAAAREANQTNIRLAREAREYSSAEAARQMAFQERMSNTAHQREMADLIAAGLNPILTATGGAGASVGPGAMGHSAMAHVQSGLDRNPLSGVAQSTLAAKKFRELELEQLKLSNRQLEQNIKASDASIYKMMEDINVGKSQQMLNSAIAERENASALAHLKSMDVMDAQIADIKAGTGLKGSQTGKVDIESKKLGHETAPYDIPVIGPALPALDKILSPVTKGFVLYKMLDSLKGPKKIGGNKIGF